MTITTKLLWPGLAALFVLLALCPAVLAAEDKMSDETFSMLCLEGSLEDVQAALAAGANVNARDQNSATALLNAIARIGGFVETDEDDLKTGRAVALLLLDKGADASIADKSGTTPLYLAAGYGLGADFMSRLIKAGANVNAKDYLKETPLMAAARENDAEAVDFLIKAGADVNASNQYKQTALIKAVTFVEADEADQIDPKVIALLIEAGADVKATDDDGKTALEILRENMQGKTSPKLKEIMAMLKKTEK